MSRGRSRCALLLSLLLRTAMRGLAYVEDEDALEQHLLDYWRRTLPPEQFETFRKLKEQARQNICEACKKITSSADVPRYSRADLLADWEAARARIRTGEAFLIVDALGDRDCQLPVTHPRH